MPRENMERTLQRAAAAIAAVLIIAFLIVFAQRSHADHVLAREAAGAQRPEVDVTTVAGAPGDNSLTLPGETSAWHESTIYARVSGYVAKWVVNIGDHVAANQLLASIDTPELDAELAAAQARLQVAQAQVRVKAAAAEFAHSSYQRWRDSPKGVVSDQEREDKKAGDASAAAELEAGRAQVNLDRAEVERLTALQQFKRVVAPYAGTITQRHIDIGNLVTAGSAANTTPLYRLVQDDPMRVFVEVPQSAAAELMKVGVSARIAPPDASGAPITGSIARTSDAIDPRARTFRAEVDIPNPDHKLVPGQYVRVGFTLPTHGLMQIPAAALVFRSSVPEVAELSRNDAVHFHPVSIARDNGDTVELNSGVTRGERLILNVSSAITEGQLAQASDGAAATSDAGSATTVARAHQ